MRLRRQSQPRPLYTETPFRSYRRLASSDSDSSSSVTTEVPQNSRHRNQHYVNDGDYIPPSSNRKQITLKNLFKDDLSRESPVEMVALLNRYHLYHRNLNRIKTRILENLPRVISQQSKLLQTILRFSHRNKIYRNQKRSIQKLIPKTSKR